MDAQYLFEWFERHGRTIRLVMIPVLFVLIGSVYLLVYATGGIKFVYSHSMYLPILFSGIVFGARGGIFFGILAGITLGPFMPIDVETGEPQQAINWLYRTGFFTLIGFLSGAASDAAMAYAGNLKWLARHDSSTGLPNRRALLDVLEKQSGRKSAPSPFLLIALSIENKMELKAAFGFAIIQEAIVQLSKRFEKQRKGNLIFHTDTAQMVLLMMHARPKEIKSVLDALFEASSEPITHDNIPIHVDMRMGYTVFDRIDEIPEVYLQRAEAALTEAYEKGQDCMAFAPAIVSATEENLSLLGELRKALDEGRLSLYYQPKISISTGEVHGAEALMRWHHPQRGDILPDIFIPSAEHSTLINLITKFALEQAIMQIAQWHRGGIDISIAVNVSPQNLMQPGFSETLLSLLKEHDVSGAMLELEITERGLMMDMEHTIRELNRLAGSKLIISIDDFGTGYSSLQYLHRLPISLIKIDQSFVRKLPQDEGAAYIVDAAVTLAHKMGIKALAEGVENQEIFDYLAAIDCDLAQGYLISPPLPAEEFHQWLSEHSRQMR